MPLLAVEAFRRHLSRTTLDTVVSHQDRCGHHRSDRFAPRPELRTIWRARAATRSFPPQERRQAAAGDRLHPRRRLAIGESAESWAPRQSARPPLAGLSPCPSRIGFRVKQSFPCKSTTPKLPCAGCAPTPSSGASTPMPSAQRVYRRVDISLHCSPHRVCKEIAFWGGGPGWP
jgi:hypothetical protein